MDTIFIHVVDTFIQSWIAPALAKGSRSQYDVTSGANYVIMPGEHLNISLNFCMSCESSCLISFQLTQRMQKDGAILTSSQAIIEPDTKSAPLDLPVRNLGGDYIIIKPGNKVAKMFITPLENSFKLVVGR